MIYLQETRDREKFVREVLNLEVDKQIQDFKKVLIKPNIVSDEPYPSTTHPVVLRACLDYFLANKKEVVVADGPAPDAGDSKSILEHHQLKVICDALDVPLLDLIKSEMRKVQSGDFTLELSSLPFQYDFILSLPVLKSHSICHFTGALKNQFGLLSKRERIKLHVGGQDIHQAIAQLNRIIKPNFYIVDAVETLINTNEVRHGGKKRSLGFMLAGSDPVGLDTLGLRLLQQVEPRLKGKSPKDILYLKHAIDLGLGNPSHEVKDPTEPSRI